MRRKYDTAIKCLGMYLLAEAVGLPIFVAVVTQHWQWLLFLVPLFVGLVLIVVGADKNGNL